MRSKHILFVAALVGIVIGLVSTYPVALSAVPGIALWAVAGVVLGYFARWGRVAWTGAVYGVLLSISFLFSRFGGTANKIGRYSLFVAGMSVVGALGGMLVVYLGSKIHRA